ncbi:hypothetical protein O6H91_01G054700 [Diphasiastrum complanatum]|uniref:Uncharacterized protein n=1 Tax=Diphasiastrum complanatum TaxID=34168 RepID=A0ACC2ER47_DIPCM|nr:hypothetical protein O6H91_01G054700 [Diphasiastrum complanatum]
MCQVWPSSGVQDWMLYISYNRLKCFKAGQIFLMCGGQKSHASPILCVCTHTHTHTHAHAHTHSHTRTHTLTHMHACTLRCMLANTWTDSTCMYAKTYMHKSEQDSHFGCEISWNSIQQGFRMKSL